MMFHLCKALSDIPAGTLSIVPGLYVHVVVLISLPNLSVNPWIELSAEVGDKLSRQVLPCNVVESARRSMEQHPRTWL